MKITKDDIISTVKIIAAVYGVIGLIHMASWIYNVYRLGWDMPFSWLFS